MKQNNNDQTAQQDLKLNVLKPSALIEYLTIAIPNKLNTLLVGAPGIGKTDMVQQACELTGYELIIAHPVVSDPTDFKGLPFPVDKKTATFLPYGELQRLITADKPLVYFLDDLGQASITVQAAAMQLLLARKINNQVISNHVTFVAATNRKQDRAGVTGILEPVKSRFAAIIEVQPDKNDWIEWALKHEMPIELIAYVKYKDEVFTASPNSDIVNIPCPRTIANVGRQQMAGLSSKLQLPIFAAAAGDAFAIDYNAFLKTFSLLPTIDVIITNPMKADIPEEPSLQYAFSLLLAQNMTESNMQNITRYLDRIGQEFTTSAVRYAITINPSLATSKSHIDWINKNQHYH